MVSPIASFFIPRRTVRSFRNVTCAVARMLVLARPGVCAGSFFARPGKPESVDVILQAVA